MSRHIFARTARIDTRGGDIHIDSVRLPYWLAEQPTVEPVGDRVPMQIVTLKVLVEGAVVIVGDLGSRIFDPIEGEVGEWARRLVREGLADIPWLRMGDL